MKHFLLPVLFAAALPALSQEAAAPAPAPAAPAPAAADPAPAAPKRPVAVSETGEVLKDAPPERPRPQPPRFGHPGMATRMTPEERAHYERMNASRLARDREMRLQVELDGQAEARREAIRAENEEAGELAAAIDALKKELDEKTAALDAIYAADETLAGIAKRRAAAEEEIRKYQGALNHEVATAMRERMRARLEEEAKEGKKPESADERYRRVQLEAQKWLAEHPGPTNEAARLASPGPVTPPRPPRARPGAPVPAAAPEAPPPTEDAAPSAPPAPAAE